MVANIGKHSQKLKYNPFLLMFLTLLCVMWPTAGWSAKKGFDVLLIIDDSNSMGGPRSSQKMEVSDRLGRRIKSVEFMRNLLYSYAHKGYAQNEPVDFRLSVIRFGTKAKIVYDWETYKYVEKGDPPRERKIPIEYLVWTNFEAAFALAIDQYSKIKFGSDLGGPDRTLVTIVVTDGAPSIPESHHLGLEDEFWEKINHDFVDHVALHNKDHKMFMVALKNPKAEEAAEFSQIKPNWEKLNFTVEEILNLVGNDRLYLILERMIDGLTQTYKGKGSIEPEKDGTFIVPCFQNRLYIQVYYLGNKKRRDILIQSPDNKLYGRHGDSFWKGDDTANRAVIDKPKPGIWKILNYDAAQQDYIFRYLPVSFKINYLYPGSNRTLLRLPRKIQAELNEMTDSFSQSDIDNCVVSGRIIFDEDTDGNKDKELEIVATSSNQSLSLESIQKYSPPVLSDHIRAQIILQAYLKGQPSAQKSTILESPWIDFSVSKDKPIQMIQGQTGQAIFNRNKGMIKVRLKFADYFQKNLFYKVDEVFKNPADCIYAKLPCVDSGDCILQSSLLNPNLSNASNRAIPLKPVDEYTLGADFEILMATNGNTDPLGGLFDCLFGNSMDVVVECLAAPGCQPEENILLMSPNNLP